MIEGYSTNGNRLFHRYGPIEYVPYLNRIKHFVVLSPQLRPYIAEHTGSRPISEVKLLLAQSVLWWGTTREYWVL